MPRLKGEAGTPGALDLLPGSETTGVSGLWNR